MRENVPDPRQSSGCSDGRAESGRREGFSRTRIRKFRWCPEASPDSARRAPLKQHLSVKYRKDHVRLPQASRCAASGDWNLRNATSGQSAAAERQRTTRAGRVCSRADRGAEIHDRLRVCRDTCRGRAVKRQCPELSCAGGSVERFLDLKDASKHAFDVPVEDRVTLVMREREDRARSRAPDSGQRHQFVQGLGQAAAVARDDLLRTALQVARSCVVAET